ncbi:hypothetical protein LINPERHAP2_LOCUS39151, partial [Linum perenne]
PSHRCFLFFGCSDRLPSILISLCFASHPRCTASSMDKSWITKHRLSQEYRDGLEIFLNFAFANNHEGEQIICP